MKKQVIEILVTSERILEKLRHLEEGRLELAKEGTSFRTLYEFAAANNLKYKYLDLAVTLEGIFLFILLDNCTDLELLHLLPRFQKLGVSILDIQETTLEGIDIAPKDKRQILDAVKRYKTIPKSKAF